VTGVARGGGQVRGERLSAENEEEVDGKESLKLQADVPCSEREKKKGGEK